MKYVIRDASVDIDENLGVRYSVDGTQKIVRVPDNALYVGLLSHSQALTIMSRPEWTPEDP